MKIHEILHETDDWDDEDPGRTYPNPMKVVDYDPELYDIAGKYEDKYLEVYKLKNNIKDLSSDVFVKARIENSSIENIPINKINPNEKYLYPEVIKSLIKGEKIKSSSEMPMFLKYKGRYYTEDGNHRVAAAYERGENDISGRVINIDEYLNNR